MDIAQLLNKKCARKEARKQKKKLASIVKKAHHEKKKVDDVVSDYLTKGKKKKKRNNQKKRPGGRAKKEQKRVAAILDEGNDEEAIYRKEIGEEKIKVLKDQMIDDDREIKKYEKLLGLNKRQNTNTPKTIADSGIADLWEFCDPTKRQNVIENDDENDLGLAQAEEVENNDVDLNEKEKSETEESIDDEDEVMDDEGESIGDIDEEMNELEDELFGDGISDNEEVENEQEEEHDISGEEDEEEYSESENEPEVKEDIYGRKVDAKTGKVIEGTSAARAMEKLEELNKNSTELAEQRAKISKTLRGSINRLNESTLVGAIKSLEELFSSNSHNDVKQIFYETFIKATQTIFALPDRLLVEYGLFIALAHVNISSEISSHFVETFTLHFFKELEGAEDKDEKALENATSLLCHLFNFKIIKAEFIIDIMAKLRDYCRDKTISLMLHALTYSGANLKKRNGPLLTKFINDTQNYFVSLPENKKEGYRMKFLIEEIMAIKNGQISSLTSKFDESVLDHFSRIFKGLTKNVENKEKELPFGLEDILHIGERGRWWIVGSAWQPGSTKADGTKIEQPKVEPKAVRFDDSLLILAKKAKMNTETRRNIFCTLMSAEDDVEAFEKLLKLGLKGSQEREIIHVMVVCVMMEATYNPYYATVIERFCNYHRRFILTTQYALWDRVKELASLKKRQRINFAFLVSDLIRLSAVQLQVLKVVNFGTIDPMTTAFLRRVFYRLLTKATDSSIIEMFNKTMKSESLKLFVEGLRLFFELSMKPESFEEAPDSKIVNKRVKLIRSLFTMVD
jgi:nucleolar MIF4G domain-containing protein 1